MSVKGAVEFGSVAPKGRFSVIGTSQMASTLSVRQFARVGAGFSAFTQAECGSALSIRSFLRGGCNCSILQQV